MTGSRSIFRYFNRPERAAYLFIAPSLTIIVVFLVVPLLSSVVVSLLHITIFFRHAVFAGLANYRKLLMDSRFWNDLRNTAVYVSFEMPLQVAISLLIAVYLARNTLFRKSLRALFFVPVVTSMTAIGITWSLMLDPVLGTIPYYFSLIGLPKPQFLNSTALALPTVIAVSVWKNFGFSMVIFIAGLQGIPRSYYEAAEIDGYGPVRQFFHITIPMLLPTLSFVVITTTIGSFQVFDVVYVMTQGGPLFSTETVVQYIYTVGFTSPYELGYASSIAEALFMIILVLTVLMYNFFLKRETEYL